LSAYADTSFLVSLYIHDSNSHAVGAQLRRAKPPFYLTPFGELELINTLQLWLFRGEMLTSSVHDAQAQIRADVEMGILALVPIPIGLYERAKQIARRRTASLGCRSLDIMHVASAEMLQADTFCTFDRAQAKLAIAEGLKVVALR